MIEVIDKFIELLEDKISNISAMEQLEEALKRLRNNIGNEDKETIYNDIEKLKQIKELISNYNSISEQSDKVFENEEIENCETDNMTSETETTETE